jgi:mannan endo-1,4-beta-mannosidase
MKFHARRDCPFLTLPLSDFFNFTHSFFHIQRKFIQPTTWLSPRKNRFMKNQLHLLLLLVIMGAARPDPLPAQDRSINPVTKNASPEARALLKFFYSISGEYLLTGQHNFPNVKGRNSQFAADYIGKTPVIYGTDWGFAKDGNSDSYLARQDIVEEAIRQNRLGSVIAICWHAAPPTTNEPVTFQPLPGANPAALASVQGHLLDQQSRDLLTPGTVLYQHWCEQVDSVAHYLKELQAAHVPILWRPYHEMNGDWFWWGGRQGEYSTSRLYRQLFDRLVNYHKLNNLVWLWSVDRPAKPERKFSLFNPGERFFDMATLDVYGSDFNQAYYDSLLSQAGGKPIALAEVGNPPTPEILKLQPRWTYYMIWAAMVRNTSRRQYDALINDAHVLSREDPAYRTAIAAYRAVDGLPMMAATDRVADFSGEWIFNEEKSSLDNGGAGNLPGKISVTQQGSELIIRKTLISEYADNTITTDTVSLDGKDRPFQPSLRNATGLLSGRRGAKGDTLFIDTKLSFPAAGRAVEWTTHETWSLQDHGKLLSILQSSQSFRGKRTVTAVFQKE